MSNLNKDVLLNLENSAYYQDRERLNVKFSTADRDSAVFYFNVTKDKKPYLLGEENVKGHVAFLHSDKSFVKDELEFNEKFNKTGQFKITVPNELLKRNGTITMQVFITEVGNSNTVVAERIVEFETEDSLIRQLSGETILQYIVEYDELQDFVKSRMDTINEQIANAEDYVTAIEEAREKGLSDIEIAKATSIQEINTLADTKLQQIRTKGDEYSTKFDEDKSYMDEKLQAFRESVKGSGVVTEGASKDWQKYKLTNDDGTRVYMKKGSFAHIDDLAPGFYETVTSDKASDQGFPAGINNASFVNLDIYKSAGGRAQYKIVQNYNYKTFFRTIHTNGVDGGWKEMVYSNSDNPFETTQESQNKANKAEANAKTYTDEKAYKMYTILFEGTVNGVGSTIPLSETLDNFIVLFVHGSYPGGSFIETMDPTNANDLIIDKTNVIGVDGSEATAFECMMAKTTREKLTITGDTYHGIKSGNGSGAKANRFTINKIVGVRKYANTTQ